MELLIIFITNCADSWRDGMIQVKDRAKSTFHYVKWIAFFTGEIYLSYLWIDKKNWEWEFMFDFIIFVGICSLSWKIIYKYSREYYDAK